MFQCPWPENCAADPYVCASKLNLIFKQIIKHEIVQNKYTL